MSSGDAERDAAQSAVIEQSLVFIDRASEALSSVLSANAAATAILTPVRPSLLCVCMFLF